MPLSGTESPDADFGEEVPRGHDPDFRQKREGGEDHHHERRDGQEERPLVKKVIEKAVPADNPRNMTGPAWTGAAEPGHGTKDPGANQPFLGSFCAVSSSQFVWAGSR